MKRKSVRISEIIKATMFIAAVLVSLFAGTKTVEASEVRILPFTGAIDYSLAQNWLYDGIGEDKAVDVFIVAPTVDTLNESNAVITPKYKERFRNAMNQQQALYAESARLYAPYYRQAAMNAYRLNDTQKEEALANAYVDISAAFKYYLEHKNNGRPVILAGFSQGADMCYRILEEFYGGTSGKAAALRDNLVAVYAIGWPMTQQMIEKYPQIVPAKGEDDLGVVVSYECEADYVTGSFVVPEGTKAISINPLNWRTDSTVASKKLNKGTVTQDSVTGAITSVTPQKCGAFIDPERGTLIVTDINSTEYPPVLDVFPDGSYHLYDNFLFFVNLQDNIKLRTNKFIQQKSLLKSA